MTWLEYVPFNVLFSIFVNCPFPVPTILNSVTPLKAVSAIVNSTFPEVLFLPMELIVEPWFGNVAVRSVWLKVSICQVLLLASFA